MSNYKIKQKIQEHILRICVHIQDFLENNHKIKTTSARPDSGMDSSYLHVYLLLSLSGVPEHWLAGSLSVWAWAVWIPVPDPHHWVLA